MHKNIFTITLFFLLPFILQSQSTQDSLRQKINQIYEQSDLSGFSASIINAEGVLFSEGYGFADKENKTPYQTNHTQIVASVSKTWIGVALMKCVEQGLLTLDSDVNDFLHYKISNPNFPNEPITIRQLATHTSSIIYSIPDHHKIFFEEKPNMKLYRWGEKRVIKKILKNKKITMGDYLQDYLAPQGKKYSTKHFGKYEPGKKYRYSNIASTLAAHLVEVVSKMAFGDFCQKNIIEPLELKNAGFNICNPDMSKTAKQYSGKKQKMLPLYSHRFYPTGGLRISNDDLNLFLMEIIKGYQGKGKLLSRKSYEELFKPQFTANNLPEDFDKNETNHGVFWTYRNDLIGHTGGGLGATCFMFFDKNTGVGKILTLNCELETNKKLIPSFLKIWKTMSEMEQRLTNSR